MSTAQDILTEYELAMELSGGRQLDMEEKFTTSKGKEELVNCLRLIADAIEKDELNIGETLLIEVVNVSGVL